MKSKDKIHRAFDIYMKLRFLMEWNTAARVNAKNSEEGKKHIDRYDSIARRANIVECYIKKGIQE